MIGCAEGVLKMQGRDLFFETPSATAGSGVLRNVLDLSFSYAWCGPEETSLRVRPESSRVNSWSVLTCRNTSSEDTACLEWS